MIDNRLVNLGWEIPTETYSDQPYVVKANDGAWVCVMTTGGGHEGQPGQHVVTCRSVDQGRTWSNLVDVEPADGPEASYAVLLKVPSSRIYCFYNHNTDNRRWVIADNPPYKDGRCYRVDSQGYFVFKYSDDHGRSWSDDRYTLPIREMAIDRQNAYEGKVQFFWNVGRPFVHNGSAYVSVHKVGGFGHGFFTSSEGVLLESPNILTESDPNKIEWVTLPDGDYGLRTPEGGGTIAEEQSYDVLSDGSFYCVYRSVDGHPVFAYSRDGGHTWSEPEYKKYANGKLMKHPRAANFAWKCENGNFVYWYHNHGGRWYDDRNPVWLSGGVEVDSPEGKIIQWSQPEIALYDDDTYIRMSYPDLVEDEGNYYLTETQKDKARTHLVASSLLEGMWGQFDEGVVTHDSILVELRSDIPDEVSIASFERFNQKDRHRADHGQLDLRSGFTIEMIVQFESLDAGQIILDTRSENGQGWCVQTTSTGTVEIILNDGRMENRWDCDPNILKTGTNHHIGIVVDGGPKIITFIVDGVLCDGGDFRQYGWGRFSNSLTHVNSVNKDRIIAPGQQGGEEISPVDYNDETQLVQLAPSLHGSLQLLRIYSRYLRTSEVVGNYKSGE